MTVQFRQATVTRANSIFMLRHLAGSVLPLLPRRPLLSSRPLSGTRRLLGRMEPAVVRCLPGEPKLTISLTVDGSNRQLLRDQSEELGKALTRISRGIVKTQADAKNIKRNKRTQKQEGGVLEELQLTVVKLFYNGAEVADTVVNSEAWQDGAVLQVGDVQYSVQRNSPSFTRAELPLSMLAGCPVCPKLQVEFGNLQDSEFTWFKESAANTR